MRIDINHDIANVTEQCRQACWRYDKTEYVRKGAAPQISLRMIFKNRLSEPRGNAPYRWHMLDGVVYFRHREQFGGRRTLLRAAKRISLRSS